MSWSQEIYSDRILINQTAADSRNRSMPLASYHLHVIGYPSGRPSSGDSSQAGVGGSRGGRMRVEGGEWGAGWGGGRLRWIFLSYEWMPSELVSGICFREGVF